MRPTWWEEALRQVVFSCERSADLTWQWSRCDYFHVCGRDFPCAKRSKVVVSTSDSDFPCNLQEMDAIFSIESTLKFLSPTSASDPSMHHASFNIMSGPAPSPCLCGCAFTASLHHDSFCLPYLKTLQDGNYRLPFDHQCKTLWLQRQFWLGHEETQDQVTEPSCVSLEPSSADLPSLF